MATRTDSTLSRVYRYIICGWPQSVDTSFSPYLTRKSELTVEGGCVLWGTRVIVLEKWRKRLLAELHRDYPGICKMKSIARSHMWWPGMDSCIEDMVKSCSDCQAVKKSPPTVPLQPWEWPSRVFQRVHIDFAGPFQGWMFFVAVDAYSKWPQVVMMQSTTASKTIDALSQIFSVYGLPEHIVSDNGPQFSSEEFAVFLKSNGIRHTRTALYHPATNGLAERFVQSLKQGLKTSQSSGRSLSKRLGDFLLMYRSTIHSTTGVIPSSLFLKRELRTRFDLIRPDREVQVARKQSQQKDDHDRHSSARQYDVGDLVMTKNFRAGPAWVPASVVARLGPLSYLLETTDKQLWRRHLDHVKARTASSVPFSQPQHDPDMWNNVGTSSEDTAEHVAESTPADSTATEAERSSMNSTGDDSQAVPEASVVSNTDVRRYPRREHHTPDYFRPEV